MSITARSEAPEPFVCAKEAAQFLSVKRAFLLSLARRGIGGSYGLGTGECRKRWIFRLSELSAAITWRGARCQPPAYGRIRL